MELSVPAPPNIQNSSEEVSFELPQVSHHLVPDNRTGLSSSSVAFRSSPAPSPASLRHTYHHRSIATDADDEEEELSADEEEEENLSDNDGDAIDLNLVRALKVIDAFRANTRVDKHAAVCKAAKAWLLLTRRNKDKNKDGEDPTRQPKRIYRRTRKQILRKQWVGNKMSRDGDDDEETESSRNASMIGIRLKSTILASTPHATSAVTSFVLPVTYGDTYLHTEPGVWAEALYERDVVLKSGESVKLWRREEECKVPSEFGDLSLQFRHILGWKEKGRENISTWKAVSMKLNKTVLKELLVQPTLWATEGRGKDEVPLVVQFKSVSLTLYPLGKAILSIKVDWLGSSSSVTLDALRTWLFIGKHRQKVPGVARGWTFTKSRTLPPARLNQAALILDPNEAAAKHNLDYSHCHCLGAAVFGALYENKACSLFALTNWMLLKAHELPWSPRAPRRVGRVKNAYHHSSVVLNEKPSSLVIEEYLFHFRRAYGQTNRPPRHQHNKGLDCVLVPRSNRYIGISREGNISFSWSTEGKRTKCLWIKKFQSIYKTLALHVIGEKTVLEELGYAVALQADNLHVAEQRGTLQAMTEARNSLRHVAVMMVRYMLSMSSDDCGGQSDYYNFFSSIRKVFAISEQRQELREELQDVLAIVESNYQEEARRIKDEKKLRSRRKKELERSAKEEKARRNKKKKKLRTRLKSIKENQRNMTELLMTIFATVTIPLVLVAGVFGMNNPDLPPYPFWSVIGFTVLFCAILFMIVIGWQTLLKRRRKRVQRKLEMQVKPTKMIMGNLTLNLEKNPGSHHNSKLPQADEGFVLSQGEESLYL